jgi:23S rRNA pseudouridine2605 synthase
MQLNKFLAQASVASRRKAVELIKQGIVRVNNTVITEPGYLVKENDIVTVEGRRITLQEHIYLLLNKPIGYVTTTADEKGRPTVMDLLGKSFKERIYPVGRLDQNTTGLLLLTNDGDLAQKLTHPRYEVAKVYQVTLDKTMQESDRQRIIKGVHLIDGIVNVDRISHPLGPQKNCVRLTLHSGRNRVVRRLFEALKYRVKKLDRVAYAMLSKRGIPLGLWRRLSKKEVSSLKKSAEGKTGGSVSKS